MGYGTRGGNLGHTIRTFWPDDTETKLYIDAGDCTSMTELMHKIEDKWPGVSLLLASFARAQLLPLQLR